MCATPAHPEPRKHHFSEDSEPSCCHQNPIHPTTLFYLLTFTITGPTNHSFIVIWFCHFVTVIGIWLSLYFFPLTLISLLHNACTLLCGLILHFLLQLLFQSKGVVPFLLTIYPVQHKTVVSILELLVIKSLLAVIDRVFMNKCFTNSGEITQRCNCCVP